MRPVAAIPLHDPDGLVLPRLNSVLEQLKQLFEKVYISISQETRNSQQAQVAWIEKDGLFKVVDIPAGISIGDHFHRLYSTASLSAFPEQLIHLCYPDRLAFALGSSYKEQFMVDVNMIPESSAPLLFMRSAAAWATHPRNYQVIERMATEAGELVFHQTLDFGWCHLVMPAGYLRFALQSTHNHDLSMVAEILMAIAGQVQTKEVDWLSWEDPFILGREAEGLKQERENDLEEVHKRLSYIVPILGLIDTAAQNSLRETSS